MHHPVTSASELKSNTPAMLRDQERVHAGSDLHSKCKIVLQMLILMVDPSAGTSALGLKTWMSRETELWR